MHKLILASAAAALMMGVSATAFAQTSDADCQNLFQRADVSKDGSLQADEAKVFIDAMNQAQVQPPDAAMVTQDEFMKACQQNAFANIDPNTIGTAATEQPATTDTTGTATTEQPATTDTTGTATTEQPATTDTTGTATTTATTDPAAPAEEPAAEQALAVPEAIMASDLIGANIYSSNNESIAEVKDVILSQEDGKATHVIVDAGDNDVAIEISQIKIAATEDGFKVVMNATQADLAKFPAINN